MELTVEVCLVAIPTVNTSIFITDHVEAIGFRTKCGMLDILSCDIQLVRPNSIEICPVWITGACIAQ
jgi:hypothetical protein